MESDSSKVDLNYLKSENYLFQTDPQWQLKVALEDDNFEAFRKHATSAAVDLEYVYQYPDYKTCLEIAICGVSEKVNKKNTTKHKLHYKVAGEKTLTQTSNIGQRLNYVKFLLMQYVEVNRINTIYSAAPIHFAIEHGNIGALELLLDDERTDVNLKSKGYTALLLAIHKFDDIDDVQQETLHLNMIKMLLKAGCNVNLPNAKGVTPVIAAVKLGLESVVSLILDYADDPPDLDSYKNVRPGITARHYIKENFPHLEPKFISKTHFSSIDTSTLYFYLLSLDESSFVQEYNNILESKKQSPLLDNNNENTMLQLATEKGLEKAVDVLLKSGTDPNATSTENAELPVAIACRKGYINILKMFIEIGSTSFKPVKGESLLQTAIKGMIFSSKNPKINFAECINTLLTNPKIDPPINVNHSDFKGNTALHYATRKGDQNVVLELLRKGACVGSRNKFNDPPLADINPNTLNTYLDECVTSNTGRLSDSDYEIRFKYSMLVNSNTLCAGKENMIPQQTNTELVDGSVISREMAALVYMTKNEQLWPLLKHPVITSFLYLKWQRISCLFIINLAVYTIFWINLICYILLENLSEKDKVNYTQIFLKINYTVACIGIILLLLRELFQFVFSTKYINYLKKSKNWLEVILIFITSWFLFSNSSGQSTKHQLSAITILLSSIELLLLIGHFPNLSTYIVMLKTVCVNFFKFILWYCILIIAFALSFHVLFTNVYNIDDKNSLNASSSVEDEPFKDPGQSVFKTIIMLTGEFDAGSMKFGIFPITSHVIFIVFVFMIPIVLVNLLSGLAVSDTQKIRANAELVVQISTVQSISYIENIFIGKLHPNSRLWNYFPLFLRMFIKLKMMCVAPFAKRITLFPDFLPLYSIVVKPNRDNSIEIPHLAHHEDDDDDDVVEAGKCCSKIWQTYRLDPQIVKNAKLLLNKKSQTSELNEIKSQLSQILKMLESR